MLLRDDDSDNHDYLTVLKNEDTRHSHASLNELLTKDTPYSVRLSEKHGHM